ncbi:MAG: C39 family peptidase [Caldilineaceae bacterium]
MVLDYLGIPKDETWLWRRLTAGDVTPFPNLEKLGPALGIIVEIHTEGALAQFEPYIEAGLPVIVAVDTDDAHYWPYVRHHAVVVIGFDEQSVYVNDPAQTEAPLAVDMDTFLLAWLRRDYQYAVIRLT